MTWICTFISIWLTNLASVWHHAEENHFLFPVALNSHISFRHTALPSKNKQTIRLLYRNKSACATLNFYPCAHILQKRFALLCVLIWTFSLPGFCLTTILLVNLTYSWSLQSTKQGSLHTSANLSTGKASRSLPFFLQFLSVCYPSSQNPSCSHSSSSSCFITTAPCFKVFYKLQIVYLWPLCTSVRNASSSKGTPKNMKPKEFLILLTLDTSP